MLVVLTQSLVIWSFFSWHNSSKIKCWKPLYFIKYIHVIRVIHFRNPLNERRSSLIFRWFRIDGESFSISRHKRQINWKINDIKINVCERGFCSFVNVGSFYVRWNFFLSSSFDKRRSMFFFYLKHVSLFYLYI